MWRGKEFRSISYTNKSSCRLPAFRVGCCGQWTVSFVRERLWFHWVAVSPCPARSYDLFVSPSSSQLLRLAVLCPARSGEWGSCWGSGSRPCEAVALAVPWTWPQLAVSDPYRYRKLSCHSRSARSLSNRCAETPTNPNRWHCVVKQKLYRLGLPFFY